MQRALKQSLGVSMMSKKSTARFVQIASLGLISQFLAGCAGFTHLTRTEPLADNQGIFIDAKQRGIFTRNGVICAEPSPDALSAIAAAQSLNVTSSDVTAGQSFSLAESAASIGLRTQSIQLMRDHMYRLCESYQNGAIGPAMYQLLHRRFQTTMVGILAIEQLTGTVRAPSVVLGGSSSSGNAEAVTKLTAMKETQLNLVNEAEKDVVAKKTSDTKAKSDLSKAQAAYAASATEDNKKAVEKANDDAETAAANLLASEGALAGRKSALASIDRSLVLAQSSGSASATGAIESLSGRMPGEIEAVAKAVTQIVSDTMDLKNGADLCAVILVQSASRNSGIDTNSEVYRKCVKKLEDNQVFTIPS
jgi:hypothetical protein